jgi:hypothetical protein
MKLIKILFLLIYYFVKTQVLIKENDEIVDSMANENNKLYYVRIENNPSKQDFIIRVVPLDDTSDPDLFVSKVTNKKYKINKKN